MVKIKNTFESNKNNMKALISIRKNYIFYIHITYIYFFF